MSCFSSAGLMNGCNHLEELEDRPFALCPIDTKKWHLAITAAKLGQRVSTDLCARERALLAIFEKHGLHADAARSRQRIAALQNSPLPHEPVLARLGVLMGYARKDLQKLAKRHGVKAGHSTRQQLARALADVDVSLGGEADAPMDLPDGENVPPNDHAQVVDLT